MNVKGGYGAASYGVYGMSKVDNIMLKFRPIAPKPVATGSGSGGSTTGKSEGYVNLGRSKRKYVRVKKDKIKRNNSKRRVHVVSSPVVTLSLLPETPDRKESKPATNFSDLVSPVQTKKLASPHVLLTFNSQEQKEEIISSRQPRVVSHVTVECVTDTCVDLEGLGCTDAERVMNMEKDTCPGFISDGEDRVVWTNKAYRQMVGEDTAVVLVRKDKWTPSPVPYPAFTCKVRVSSAANSGRLTTLPCIPTLTLPCDVWRMQHGACAWRLDVKAALSLGR